MPGLSSADIMEGQRSDQSTTSHVKDEIKIPSQQSEDKPTILVDVSGNPLTSKTLNPSPISSGIVQEQEMLPQTPAQTKAPVEPAEIRYDQYQNIEGISFEEIKEGEPGFDEAETLSLSDLNAPNEEVERKLREGLIDENWWLKPEWKEKGLPKEQIEITAGDKKVNVYNFNKPLTEKHLEALRRVVGDFSKIKEGKVFEDIKYILIDNGRHENSFTGKDGYGYCSTHIKAIELYPPWE